ncbi:MAG: cache domain-containing protein [Leptospiraceae bacterium]|nr:cache domain-containing protein [Leptospiraceae bacterium]
MKIKHKLILANAIFIFVIIMGGLVLDFLVKRSIEKNIEEHLQKISMGSMIAVKTAMNASIKNHLQTIAIKSKDIVKYHYELYKSGKLSEKEAFQRVKSIFLDKAHGKVGTTGYLAGVNGKGVIVIHPKAEGVDVSSKAFMQKAMSMKVGYLEYPWKNPGETKERLKAAGLEYFEPWDLIIWVSSYKDEFNTLVNPDNFRDEILSIRIGKNGYVYVIDGTGNLIIHPKLSNINLSNSGDSNSTLFIKNILKLKNGSITYEWKNPDEIKTQKKIAYFRHVPELDWYIIANSYYSEAYSGLKVIRSTILLIILTVVSLLILVSLKAISLIMQPISLLKSGSTEIANGNLEYRIRINGKDEIAELAKNFNLMTRKLRYSFKKIKNQNEQLEEKVILRTRELSDTLDKVQKLKYQQDGDYFLTALLTTPLMQNNNSSKTIQTEFIIDQKKKFAFKNREYSLGGDVCMADNLSIGNKNYVVFFNADAMGKSMQGAGGALVIASVIKAIVDRTKNEEEVHKIQAEIWLEETYEEIQKIMLSFDGSMMASCILGLIEEETGFTQYFNAEHPFCILYRDGKASFLEKEINTFKIGMPIELNFSINKVLLEDGDILICGSDGRDDIILNENGILNENEFQILRFIEECNANLIKIREKLVTSGTLTDDLSLLKISFHKDKNNNR